MADVNSPSSSTPPHPLRHLARIVFTTFLFTFIASRVLVILIMLRKMPDLFLHLGGTHVHHLNYGIFLLSTVGAVLLFAQLDMREKELTAIAYGFGMALTFDEFGMWLHLGGGYWQRASFDAVIVVLSVLGLIAFAPRWDRLRSHHYFTAALALIAVAGFYWMLFKSLATAGKKIGPRLETIEQSGPQ